MIYCDTDTFLNNIKRHEDEPRAQEACPGAFVDRAGQWLLDVSFTRPLSV
jgi:hypothetical protein